MKIDFCNSNDKAYQSRLNKLLAPTFLDFNFWYDMDLWDANYESYSIADNGEIAANVCVYRTKILLDTRQYDALSFGAVTTAKPHRDKGLSRLLIEHIIEKYADMPMYLFANDSVLQFYQRFGFVCAKEKLPVAQIAIHNNHASRKLALDNPKIWDYVYNRVNFSGRLDCLNTASINLFHLRQGYLNGRVYDISALDTIVVATLKREKLHIHAVFSLREICFAELAAHLPFKGVSEISFGFMPHWDDLRYEMTEYQGEPLFVRGINCDLGDFKFPELSVT